MNDLQSKLLESFKWLVDYLEKGNYRYYALGGTFLGAVRHKGFIPWDDDIDIGMPRADYDRLLNNFKENENYLLEYPRNNDPEYFYCYAKLYNKKTTLVEDKSIKFRRGIFIDIFPIDGIGNTKENSISLYRRIKRKLNLWAAKTCRWKKGRVFYKNLSTLIARILPFNCKKIAISLDELVSKNDFDECQFVGNLLSTYRTKEIMAKDIFGTPKEYIFEGIKICGPAKYNEYLTSLFGDWKELPSLKNRKSSHDYIELDLNNSWLK